MLRGKIAKRPKKARKGLSPNLGKKKTTANLPTKESNKRKKNLHYPSPPNPPWNEINNTSSTPLSNAGAHAAHTHTHTETRQNKNKTSKQAKLQNK